MSETPKAPSPDLVESVGGTKAQSTRPEMTAGVRFRILRMHAAGGLGQVYVAEDLELHREIALKEIQDRYADDLESRGRFLREAEITGGLEHPGIVPVYAIGKYVTGRPYYAMRFIRGESLEAAIDSFHRGKQAKSSRAERGLAFRQLLQRFVAVCDAIAYAHSRGVLHRDLKPDNIMLGKYGETLVVDWGLAKPTALGELSKPEERLAVSPELIQDEKPLLPSPGYAVTPTMAGAAMGTPAYMSPEQAAGRLDELGPASDIYSLGATLYHLLVGQPPIWERDLSTLLRKVQRGEFERPSQVKKDIPIALETVCLKAMALSPSDRYATARQLADELEHWLADEPVLAYREPFSTRLGRSVRRHQAVVAGFTASLLATMVLLGTGAFLLERHRTAQRAERTREEARLRNTAESSLLEVERLQGQARWGEASAFLAQMEASLQDRGPADLRKKIQESKADLAMVSKLDAIRLARSTTVKGEFRLAESDGAYKVAFEAAGLDANGGDIGLIADKVAKSNIKAPLIAALDDWAACTADPKRRDRLLELARRADPDPWRDRARDPNIWKNPEALSKLLAEEAAANQSPQLIVAMAYGLQGTQDQQLQLLQKCQRQHPDDFWLNFALGNALAASDTAESLGHYRAALALRPDSAVVMNNLGTALQRQKRFPEAQTEFERAIAIQPSFVLPHFNLGRVFQDQKQYEKAMKEYQETIKLDPKLAQPHNNLGNLLQEQDHPDLAKEEYMKAIRLDAKFAQPHNNLGNLLREEGAPEKAVGEFRTAVQLDPKDSSPHVNLGAILLEQRQLDQAKEEFKTAIALNPGDAFSYSNLGEIFRRQKQWDEASGASAKALSLDPENPSIRSNRGLLLADQGKLEDAKIEFLAAIRLNPKEAQYPYNLGEVLRLLKRFNEAKSAFESALRLDPKLASAHYSLGQVFRNLSELDKAKAEFRSAIAIDSQFLPAQAQLATILLDQKLYEESEAVWRKALMLAPRSAILHGGLGKVLSARHRWPESQVEFKRAIELDANDATFHNNLGLSFVMQKDAIAARAEWAIAIKLDPKLAGPHHNLGNLLASEHKLDDAALEYQEAIKVDSKNPEYHESLANVLHAQGKLGQALEEYHKAVDLGRKQTLVAMRACEREASLQKRLPGLLNGSDKPGDNAESLAFAQLCQQPYERHFYLAARLFSESFDADSKLVDDLQHAYRYHAARSASGAALGQDKDSAKISAEERVRLRNRAFQWLKADLAQRTTAARNGRPEDRASLRDMLKLWLKDPSFSGLRTQSILARFPETERSNWRNFWKEVEQLLAALDKNGK